LSRCLIKFRDAVQRDVPRATFEQSRHQSFRIGIANRTTRWPPLLFNRQIDLTEVVAVGQLRAKHANLGYPMQQIGMRVDFFNALQEIGKQLLGLGPIYACFWAFVALRQFGRTQAAPCGMTGVVAQSRRALLKPFRKNLRTCSECALAAGINLRSFRGAAANSVVSAYQGNAFGAEKSARPICAVCCGVIQRRAMLISASVAPLLRAHASAAGALYLAT
jgi:hypothetical protein